MKKNVSKIQFLIRFQYAQSALFFFFFLVSIFIDMIDDIRITDQLNFSEIALLNVEINVIFAHNF